MATRGATKTRGITSDGMDYEHRQTIASHYKEIVLTKSRWKKMACLHLSLLAILVFRLSTSFFVLASVRPPSFLQKLKLPKAYIWEYVWLFSIIPVIFGWISCRKNKASLMRHSVLGNILVGLVPTVYASYDHFDELKLYISDRSSYDMYFIGFPAISYFYIFIAIAIQIVCFEIYFGYCLVVNWKGSMKSHKTW